MMKNGAIVALLLFLLGCATGNTTTQGAEDIVGNLERQGRPYFDYLVKTNRYESVLDKIESGDVTLIRGSRLLSRFSDASTSLSLRYALSRALIQEPNEVMKLIPDYFSVQDICTIPYIEASSDVELAHINSSIGALEHEEYDDSEKYMQCIAIYKKIREGMTGRLNE